VADTVGDIGPCTTVDFKTFLYTIVVSDRRMLHIEPISTKVLVTVQKCYSTSTDSSSPTSSLFWDVKLWRIYIGDARTVLCL
jgi:hypothetical protein